MLKELRNKQILGITLFGSKFERIVLWMNLALSTVNDKISMILKKILEITNLKYSIKFLVNNK